LPLYALTVNGSSTYAPFFCIMRGHHLGKCTNPMLPIKMAITSTNRTIQEP